VNEQRRNRGEAEFGERLRDFGHALAEALRTRGAIFRAESRQKARGYRAAAIFIAVAAACVAVAAVLLAALLVAVFSSLLQSVALGVAATLLLYIAAAAALALAAARKIKTLPRGFPQTRETLRRDFSAFDAALGKRSGDHADDEDAGSLD
jgi:uncharacterized membrane protein YqjE